MVSGVLSYAAFVDVGVCKDGMLHVSEVQPLVGRFVDDLRELVAVGDKLPLLYLLAVDERAGRFSLTTRTPPPKTAPPPTSTPSGREVPPQVMASSCRAAEAFPPLTRGPAAIDEREGTRGAAGERDGRRSEETAEAGDGRGEAPARAHQDGGMAPSVPSFVNIAANVEETPALAAAPPKEAARVAIGGRVHILYVMPWKVR